MCCHDIDCNIHMIFEVLYDTNPTTQKSLELDKQIEKYREEKVREIIGIVR